MLQGGRPAEREELVEASRYCGRDREWDWWSAFYPDRPEPTVIPAIELRQLAAAPIADASSTWLLGCITVAPARAQLGTEEEKAT